MLSTLPTPLGVRLAPARLHVPVVALLEDAAVRPEPQECDAGERLLASSRGDHGPVFDDRAVAAHDQLAEAALDCLLVGEGPVGVSTRVVVFAERGRAKNGVVGVEHGNPTRIVFAPALRPLRGPPLCSSSRLHHRTRTSGVETNVAWSPRGGGSGIGPPDAGAIRPSSASSYRNRKHHASPRKIASSSSWFARKSSSGVRAPSSSSVSSWRFVRESGACSSLRRLSAAARYGSSAISGARSSSPAVTARQASRAAAIVDSMSRRRVGQSASSRSASRLPR